MLKVELTKNYGGFKISGAYDDLNYLYDTIHYFSEISKLIDFLVKNRYIIVN